MIWLLTYIAIGVVVLLLLATVHDDAPPAAAMLMVIALWPLIAAVLAGFAVLDIIAAIRTIGRERDADRDHRRPCGFGSGTDRFDRVEETKA